jgi:hypothetical protein
MFQIPKLFILAISRNFAVHDIKEWREAWKIMNENDSIFSESPVELLTALFSGVASGLPESNIKQKLQLFAKCIQNWEDADLILDFFEYTLPTFT